MNSNFSKKQINTVKNFLGINFNVEEISRSGNINVSIKGNDTEHWVLYARPGNKFLWRRINDLTGTVHPLNMGTRKTREIVYRGQKYTEKYYHVNMSYINTFEEAVNYIGKYMSKYRNIHII